MQSESSGHQFIRFGTFELDVRAGELRRQGVKIKLQEQPLRVLEMLLANPAELVTREELRATLWPSDTFVDFDHGLNKAIAKLREALGDSAENPRFIETLAKRGYRFLESAATRTHEPSIAVLPFLSLSTDPENELFADGMSDEIISTLAQIKNLHVVARTSSFSLKGKYLDLRMIGKQFDVSTVLEGSVRKSGDRLRITAQLVSAADGYHLWSQQYERDMKDIFAIQKEIAQSIAQTLELSLDPESQPLARGGTESVEAFKFYVKGRALFFQRGVQLIPAIECFRNAVAADPRYGLAWSGMADAYNMLGFYGFAKPGACLPQAKDATQRAIALDPALAEAHHSQAMSHLFCDWDRPGAEREFLRSFELKAHNSLARGWYGLFFLQWAAGRFEEGLAQAKQAVRIDPLSAWARAVLAMTYFPIDGERSLQTALESIQIAPDFYLGRWVQITALNLQGRLTDAAEVGELTLKLFGRPVWVMASLARAYARMGRHADAKALYMELRWRAERDYVSPTFLALAAHAAGEQDEAIRLSQQAHAIGDPPSLDVKYWPDFEELREDPRFQKILRARGWT